MVRPRSRKRGALLGGGVAVPHEDLFRGVALGACGDFPGAVQEEVLVNPVSGGQNDSGAEAQADAGKALGEVTDTFKEPFDESNRAIGARFRQVEDKGIAVLAPGEVDSTDVGGDEPGKTGHE